MKMGAARPTMNALVGLNSSGQKERGEWLLLAIVAIYFTLLCNTAAVCYTGLDTFMLEQRWRNGRTNKATADMVAETFKTSHAYWVDCIGCCSHRPDYPDYLRLHLHLGLDRTHCHR